MAAADGCDELPAAEVDSWTKDGLVAAESAAPDGSLDLEAACLDDDVDLSLLARFAPGLAERVVSIRLEGCGVSSLAASCPVLQELAITQGSIRSGCSWASAGLGTVVSLDVSGTSGWEGAAGQLAGAMPLLQRFAAAGCDLDDESLALVAAALPPHVAELDVSDNEEVEGCGWMAGCPAAAALRSLDVRGTAAFDVRPAAVREAAAAAFPRLVALNGAALRGAGPLRRTSGRAPDEAGAGAITLGDAASCSCLEGEPVRGGARAPRSLRLRLAVSAADPAAVRSRPNRDPRPRCAPQCVDPENCKDWVNRFKIARIVRPRRA